MKLRKKFIVAVIATAATWLITSTVWAGSQQRHPLQNVTIGFAGFVVGSMPLNHSLSAHRTHFGYEHQHWRGFPIYRYGYGNRYHDGAYRHERHGHFGHVEPWFDSHADRFRHGNDEHWRKDQGRFHDWNESHPWGDRDRNHHDGRR